MSMINDALKRAAQKPASPPSASEITAGLRPAEERPRGFPVLTLFIVLIPLIALGIWFLVKGLQMEEQPDTAPAETISARISEPMTPVSVPAPIIVVPPTNPPPAIAAAPVERVFKLQGIFWRPSKPSAVINGKTVYIGDRVETARVTAVDQESVTLNVDGESKTLLIP